MFTVSQIAAALGASRQSVHQALFSVVPVQGKQLMRGSEANAWTFAVLPSSMQAKLQRRAKAKGYRNAEHLLADPPRRFESPVPVGQLAGPIQQRAMKLREAMARPLAEFASGMKGGALEEIGLRQYQRVFGFEITSRHWRTLFQRTLDRDAGEEQWDRLDLYLDANPRGRAKAARLHSAERDAETLLLSYASQIRQPGVPTDDEKVMLWQTAFEQMEELGQSGVPLKKARKLMRRALWKCGAMLAKTESALACAWIRKEEAWRAADGNIAALKDRRAISSGNFRSPDIPQNDVDLVIGYAVKFNGRVSQAWRHVLENRMLSADIQSHYEGLFPASKSYVPRVIRNAVRHEVREMRNIHHGPRTADLNGAYITRKWDDVAAGDWYQADDVTLNNYYYAPDGNGGWTLIRGQVLLMIDVRSMCILSFAILDQRNYTSHAIRTLITRTCDDHGLPRQGFYFERGIWEKSRLLKGDSSVDSKGLSWVETERGLRELGMRFMHSRRPLSKPVERVIGQLQDLLDGEPGDAGRNEMKDGFERLQDRKRQAERGEVAASDYFYSYDQWTERLTQFCEEYNNARNDGKMTRGLTPFQAWGHFQTDPLVKLPPEARYLLSHHKRPTTVGRNGITLRFGKRNFTYRNAKTGELRGRQVLAWFNPELPELLAVTDMNRENCFTVERSEDVPATDAPEDMLQREMERMAAHNGYARQRYRTLARLANLNPRPTIMDRPTAELGRAIESQAKEVRAKRHERRNLESVGRAVLVDAGITPRSMNGLRPEQIEAAKRLKQARQEFKQKHLHE